MKWLYYGDMTDLEREHLLHRVVAGSAFLFALCILPVAQYYLVTNQLPESANLPKNGEVAGASVQETVETITQANIPAGEAIFQTQEECVAQKQKDWDNLVRFMDGKKLALLRTYQIAVDPYEKTLASLQEDEGAAQSEIDALNQLIDQEYQPYIQKLKEVQSAVDSQKNSIESRACPE